MNKHFAYIIVITLSIVLLSAFICTLVHSQQMLLIELSHELEMKRIEYDLEELIK